MDPKNQLDPRLKEAYERVMNASPGVTTAPPPPASLPQPVATPVFTPKPAPFPSISQKPSGGSADSGHSQNFTPNNKNQTSPILIAFGVILFFLVYSFFWIKLFNVSLPFFNSGTNNPTSGQNKVNNPPILPTAAPKATPTAVVSPAITTPTQGIIPTAVPTQAVGSGSAVTP